MFYCAKNNGFYIDKAHYTKAGFLDSDVVQITQKEHQFLLAEQTNGLVIASNDAGYPIAIEYILTGDELIQAQYDAIENHISVTLKTANIIGEPADYDGISDLVGYRTSNNDQYRIEANTLWNWAEVCHERQYQIKHGVIKYDSVDDAIASLPPL